MPFKNYPLGGYFECICLSKGCGSINQRLWFYYVHENLYSVSLMTVVVPLSALLIVCFGYIAFCSN